MNREIAVLQALLRNFHRSINSPALSRKLIYARGFFHDDLIRAACLALLFNYGDWQAARNDLAGFPAGRVQRLCVWASKIQRGAKE